MAIVLELTTISGSQVSRKLTIRGRESKIGSAPNCDVVIQERQIEPRHAEIHHMLDRFFVVPLTPQSKGISLNGLPIHERSRLKPGDVLTLGVTSYRVSFSEQLEMEVGATHSKTDVPRLGEYFVRRNVMSQDQVTRTVQRQSELRRNGQTITFGQLAYELGFINRSQLDSGLSDQRNDFNQRFRD